MKLNILDEDGYYLGDYVVGEFPERWTSDLVGDGYYKAQYRNGVTDNDTGEVTLGSWIETGGVSKEDEALLKSLATETAKVSKVDKMSRATGIISTLQDAIDAGVAGEEESLSLPLWKEYRLALYRVDVTLAPDITWPVAPDELPVGIEEVLVEPVAKVKFSM